MLGDSAVTATAAAATASETTPLIPAPSLQLDFAYLL